jgi:hypothetical protein
MYEIIEAELKGVQQALHSSHTVSTTPPSSEGTVLGDKPAQLLRKVDATEARLCRVQKEKQKVALKKEKEEAREQHWVVQQEKEDIQAYFVEDRE